ncbi:MAG: hypothetical protein NW237_13265 [Cyanobacteriota bacterium]|nr:hypothetical protein [Cyanobacteriota bacterium]
MSCSLVPPTVPEMGSLSSPPQDPLPDPLHLHFLVVEIPLPRPFLFSVVQADLHQAIQEQLGSYQMVRWAITSVAEPTLPAIIEAVVTTLSTHTEGDLQGKRSDGNAKGSSPPFPA